jgi:zinc D-Ala-D-Ala carboxypeptidase
MAETKVAGIGSNLSKEVIDQIDRRRAIIGKQGQKTSDDLLFLLANTAWIKLSSGVNVLSEDELKIVRQQKQRDTITGDSTLAKNNILLGGTLSPQQGLRAGIDTTLSPNPNAAYRNNPKSSGIRPMPGITGMSVKTKNTFGTLREAEIQISAWTLEDFETIEQIYLRPGFTFLLEWGNSIYLDNDGNLQKQVKTIDAERFFLNNVSFDDIGNQIKEIRKKSSGNYEAMVGYAKNFSWSYTPAGEYQCTLTIISTGVILESLKTRIDPTEKGIPQSRLTTTDAEKNTSLSKSPIHYFQYTLQQNKQPFSYSNENLSQQRHPEFYEKLRQFPVFYQSVDYKNAANLIKDDTFPTYWIPLYAILEVFTKYLHSIDTSKGPDDVNRYSPKFYSDPDGTILNEYLTFPGHFSIDPDICILPRKYKLDELELGKVNNVWNNLDKVDWKGGKDNVLNILIQVNTVVGIVDQAIDDEFAFTKSSNEIIQQLLDSVDTALGGITDLQLAFDEEYEGGTFFVVDRNNTPKDQTPPQLTLAGIDSIFTEVSISSTISNEIASQISIAAQGSSQNTSENVENILRWNPGVVDRVHRVKGTGETTADGEQEAEKKKQQALKDWIENLKKFFNGYNGRGWKEEQKTAARTLFEQTMVRYLHKNTKQNNDPIPGVVPVELSFKMDGLGGFKIGEAFTIAGGILPSKYQGKFGYIITGLEHSIASNHRWETSVKAQFYLIEKTESPESTAAQEIAQDIKTGVSAAQGTSTAPANKYTSQSCVDDSRIKLSPNFNLAQLSCAGIVVKASIPASGQLKSHPTFGNLTREDIINNLKNLAINVLEPIKRAHPTMFVTNAYRNNGGKSQHEAGMAADIQFSDMTGSLSTQNAFILQKATAIKALLGKNYDQFLLEYKTNRGGRPWLHISYKSTGNRNEASTFLNDTYAVNGRNNLRNPLV